MKGVILDADSLGSDIDLTPVTSLLDTWQVYPSTLADETAARIADADVVLSNKVRLDNTSLKGADSLKFISVMATGTNNIDFAATRARGIAVCNAVAYATPSVVQHTISLILTLSTNLHRYLADVQNGRWQASNVFCRLDYPIQEIAGKNLGILGYGELGRHVAEAARGLGMNILIGEQPGKAARPGRLVYNDLLAESDYLTLHCPLTADNAHLINSETLAQMKPSAFLINTARGGLVDSEALLDALRNGSVAGAAIDVLDVEPAAAGEPLITDLPNLLVTPHNAWGAIESRTRLVTQMRENIQGFLAGTPPRLVAG